MLPALGEELANIIVLMSHHHRNKIIELVDGDPDSTFTNQLAMYGWMVREHVHSSLSSNEANAVLSAMHQRIFSETENVWENWNEFKCFTSNRRKGFENARADTDGDQMLHIVNYFVACCSVDWQEVDCGDIAPNPDDLELIKEHLADPSLVARLRSRQQSKGLPIYSYANSLKQSADIGSLLAALAKQAQTLLAAEC